MTGEAELDWTAEGAPVSRRFGDPYFSLADGLAETRHVFLSGNGLPGRFAPGFSIAELGFGTGLNFLAAWQAWEGSGTPGPLSFTSFEAFPMAPADRARALARWPELGAHAVRMGEAGPGRHHLGSAILTVVPGDARVTVPSWAGAADAWFLDGFSPARNPQMWEPALLAAVFARTRPGGSFATYSAAGHVRRALAAAGFAVEKRRGFGRKREMCCGTRPRHASVA